MALIRYGKSGFTLQSLVDGSSSWWTNSGTTSGEYYYNQADIDRKPRGVYAGGVYLTEGTLGSLNNGEWAWGDQDSIGADGLYIKVSVGDPGAQVADYVQCSQDYTFVTINSEEILGVTSFMVSNSSSYTADVNIRFVSSDTTELFNFDLSIEAANPPQSLNERFVLYGGDKIIVNSGVEDLSVYISGMEE